MKAIIVAERNKEKIAAAIKEAEGRSRERTITVDQIFEFCGKIAGVYRIHKKDLEGSTFYVDRYAQNFPAAYKYRAQSTHFTVRYEKGRFLLTEVCRDYTRRDTQRVLADLSQATKAAIIKACETLDTY